MPKMKKNRIEKIKKYVSLNKAKVVYMSIFVIYTLSVLLFVIFNRDALSSCSNSGSISKYISEGETAVRPNEADDSDKAKDSDKADDSDKAKDNDKADDSDKAKDSDKTEDSEKVKDSDKADDSDKAKDSDKTKDSDKADVSK